MRIFLLHLILSLPLVWSLEMEQHHRQKRQLDWTSSKIYHYDHLAVSSNQEEEEDVDFGPVKSPSGLPGEPGIDYPILPSIPLTNFHCRGRVAGFYGDTQTACQVFHVCDMSGRQDSFLCPNGTIFSQKLFACDWWYNVQCATTRDHYTLNRNLYRGSNFNLYGTPSFWNWLSETEETYPQPGSTRPPTTLAPRTTTAESTGRQPKTRPNLVANPPVVPLASPIQLEQPVPTVQPTSAPAALFLPPVQPVVVATPVPTQPLLQPPVQTQQSQGFTRDYQDYYFGWIHEAIDPPSPDMVPELSWADLGPNGPMMSESDEPVIVAPVVDRRRKAKPIQQTKKQQPVRPAPVVQATPSKSVYVSKPTSVHKKPVQSQEYLGYPITAAPKLIGPKVPVSTRINPALSLSPPPITKPYPKPPINKNNKSKAKQTTRPKTTTTTTTTTTKRPRAQSDYSYDDDDIDDIDDVVYNYDESPTRLEQASLKSRNAIRSPSPESRSDTRRKNFIPSPRVTTRSDDLVAEPVSRYAKSIVLQPFSRQTTPLSKQSRAQSNPVSSRPALRASHHPTLRPLARSIHQPEVRQHFSPVNKSPTGVVMERFSPAFRPSQPIPAVTSNSHQPRNRALRAHPSPAAGIKQRKRKTKEVAYDPRLGRPYGQNHPIWKLQNWESTKI